MANQDKMRPIVEKLCRDQNWHVERVMSDPRSAIAVYQVAMTETIQAILRMPRGVDCVGIFRRAHMLREVAGPSLDATCAPILETGFHLYVEPRRTVEAIPYALYAWVKGQLLIKKEMTADEILLATQSALLAVRGPHDQGLVHRDVKFSNLIEDETNRPILIDFDTFCREGDPQKGFFTTAYAPPERADLETRVTTKYDIFTIAAAAAHRLGEEVRRILDLYTIPEEDRTPEGLLRFLRRRSDKLPLSSEQTRALNDHVRTLPEADQASTQRLVNMIVNCLRKNPEERPDTPTASAILNDRGNLNQT